MADVWVTEAEDDALALAARQDAAAFAELYRRHLNRVYRLEEALGVAESMP